MNFFRTIKFDGLDVNSTPYFVINIFMHMLTDLKIVTQFYISVS